MSALGLKLIACLTMLIDHTALTLYITGHLGAGALYEVLRSIGRVAFPVFGFQIVQGAIHTSNRKKYLLRLFIFSLISEVPFDTALMGHLIWLRAQNVYFTLGLGLMSVYLLKWSAEKTGKKRAVCTALWLIGTVFLGLIAELLETDYGWAGVFMIAVMGLEVLPAGKVRFMVGSSSLYQTLIAAAGIAVCIALTSSAELCAVFALIPIYFYNGTRGKLSKPVRTGFYFFYPVHLFLLALIFVWPLIRGQYL